MAAAAARGLGLVAAAIAIGIILLQLTDTSPAPHSSNVASAEAPTTTTTTAPAGSATGVRPPTQVQVLVLNAKRQAGIAGDLTDILKSKGYPTATPSNAPKQDTTVIYFKPGFEREAQQLKPTIGDETLVEPLPDPSPYAGTEEVDLVVVLGTNYKPLSTTATTTTTGATSAG